MRIAVMVLAAAALPAVVVGQAGPVKRKPLLTPPASAPAPTPSAVVAIPSGTLQLRDVGKGNDTPAQNWIEMAGLAAGGAVKTVWVLNVMPTDQNAGGKTVAATWAQMRVDCTARSVTPVHLAMIDAAGNVVQRAGPLPPTPTTPQPPSGLGKVVAAACAMLVPAPSYASSAAQAVQWTRNPALAAAAATPKAPPKPAAQAQAEPPPAPVPTGKLALKDMALGIGAFYDSGTLGPAAYRDGIYSRYLHSVENAPKGSGDWTLTVLRQDRPLTRRDGTPFNAAGYWANWVADCDKRSLKVRHVVFVSGAGATYTASASQLPPQAVTRDPRSGEELSLPKMDGAMKIYRLQCMAVADAVLANIWGGEIFAASHPSAVAAITAARRARNLTATERKAAIECLGQIEAYNFVAQTALRSKMGKVMGQSSEGQRLHLSMLIEAALGGSYPVSEAAVARARRTGFVSEAAALEDFSQEQQFLNKCLVDLPLGAEPGQFR